MITEVMVWQCTCGEHSLTLDDLIPCKRKENEGNADHEVDVGRFVRAESSRDQGSATSPPPARNLHTIR